MWERSNERRTLPPRLVRPQGGQTVSIRTQPPPGSRSALPPGPANAPDWQCVAGLLSAWFSGAARDLPWRRARSGYAALVSELMLQQTQVDRVVPAFERFMARFPSVEVLAAAPEQEVLAAWQGLGYYRRARLLHAAARTVMASHAGVVPGESGALQALPGVGRYTAGAIASIVFGEQAPIVDGNVFRVLARLSARRAPFTDRAASATAWHDAEALVRAAVAPGVANEALMELGATVCTPAAPRCAACPLAHLCRARAAGAPEEFPAPKPRAERRTVYWHALVAVNGGAVLLEPRGERGLWARMWQVPTLEADEPRAAPALAAHWGVGCRRVAEFEHVTTHRRVLFAVHVVNECAGHPSGDRSLVAAGAPMDAASADTAANEATTADTTTADSTTAEAANTRPADAFGGRGAHWVPLARVPEFPLPNAMWRVLEAAGVAVSPPPSAAGRRRTRAPRSAATGS